MNGSTVRVSLGGREYPLSRARLGRFLDLQRQRSVLAEAVKRSDTGAIAEAVIGYLQTGLASVDLNFGFYASRPWSELLAGFRAVEECNRIPKADEFALMRDRPRGKPQRDPLDHHHRTAKVWFHRLASAYHWTVEEISNLWPEDAIGFLQEILIEHQLEREFQHSLSTIAYPLDKRNKGKYKPLQRPAWMIQAAMDQAPEKGPIARKVLPLGAVIYPEGSEAFSLHPVKHDERHPSVDDPAA